MAEDPDALPVLLDVSTAAAHLGIPEGTLRRLVAKREAPYTRIAGRYLRFTPEHLREIIKRWEQPARPLSDPESVRLRSGVSGRRRREDTKPSGPRKA